MSTTLALLSPATARTSGVSASIRFPQAPVISFLRHCPSSLSIHRSRKWKIFCDVALRSSSALETSTSFSQEEAVIDEFASQIGSKVRVTVPLKVYHVPRVPEVDLTGMEGVFKQNVTVWKGKLVSANFPCKVEFVKEIEGRGPVKFSAHLREDEFEFI